RVKQFLGNRGGFDGHARSVLRLRRRAGGFIRDVRSQIATGGVRMPLAKGDTMKIVAAAATTLMLTVPAFSQQTVTQDTTTGLYMSAGDVAAAVGKLPKNPLASVPVFKIGPFNVNVEHRLGTPAAAQASSVHDKDAELFYMIEGTATLVTGGKLVEG